MFSFHMFLSRKENKHTTLKANDFKNNNITTKLYHKGDAFGFHIVNFTFMSSNIPSAPAYGVYAPQLIRYAVVAQIIVTFYYATRL